MLSINKRHALRCCALAALLLFPRSLLADVLVVTAANAPPIALSKNQISYVFLGKLTSLPDGSSTIPIDQAESNLLRDEFYLKVTNKSAAQAKAHWAKLYFTGRGVPPHEAVDSDDVKRILNSTPGAIGYIERTALDSSVRVIFDAH
jgi:hypothetical protein